jgi:murein DD-endopeptidase MepM/ murein hydrolase activator NlpD
MKKRARHSVPLSALFVAFCAGAGSMWALYFYGPPKPAYIEPRLEADNRTAIRPAPGATPPATAGVDARTSRTPPLGSERAVATTGAARNLLVPIEGSDIESWKGGFVERRGHGPHEAVDILAPRNTPIHAVSDGTIAKLFFSKAGGITIYQFDPSGEFCYYYAHLERYADTLREGLAVKQGDVIGYVGTSGNAPPGTPHLHFAVFKLADGQHWWEGQALDPYEVFRK